MTEREFGLFMYAMRTMYPKDNIPVKEDAVAMWYELLKDIPYKVAEAFLQKWTLTNKWSPTIADIRQGTAEAVHGITPDWGKGWEEAQQRASVPLPCALQGNPDTC